jgi:hypothetical protein
MCALRCCTVILIVVYRVVSAPAFTETKTVLFREDFNTLQNWEPFFFSTIEKHSTYAIVADGTSAYLEAHSNASASALIYKKTFNVYDYPMVSWRWKVDNIYQGGNAKTKKGDDYPLRVYITFPFDQGKAGFLEKVKYASARLVFGEYPPQSCLNYIWANRHFEEDVLTSSYTEKSKLIPLKSGSELAGMWQSEEINIIEDYRRAFGSKPPETARLAIMNDSDNTGESSVSYLDYIEVYREKRENDS